ncbi:uncharacterized protein Z519_00880 [Cladophialophora bantiana CBS 173.52]|uniref:DUF6594 domain-containing protein n=1 Tax=Cladophialophora bantiana (strain ATCC 10958 / CBS 173.52 / CDC B-1940 / NIH 8579) TaxID=1442370 RepID=A0A0D2GLF4_CLAB1|nr:uncharacterized protein Z519_00880 [Cladophialophora bantiana CBS 173.52]KIW99217.1 hypothetical protein Z519_00880 [Cladophialophora bantiana CBS 173.52]
MDAYTRLSSMQASQPEYAIFRLYLPLQALQLNLLQAEIAHLRQGLGAAELELKGRSGNTEKLFSHFPSRQTQSSSEKEPQSSLQKALWDRLEAALKKYSKALLRYRALSQLPSVDRLHHKQLRTWNSDLEGGDGSLRGAEAVVWDEENAGDLTSIALPSESRDPLTYFLQTRVLPWYHNTIGYRYRSPTYVADAFTDMRQQTPIYYYSDRLIILAVNICSTVLSSMIPALCSLALYFIRREGARMGAIVGFTFLFSVIIALITPAKKIETFVATAAFAAVLIVFVGNGNGNAGGCVC